MESILESSQQIISRIEEILTHDKEKKHKFQLNSNSNEIVISDSFTTRKRTHL